MEVEFGKVSYIDSWMTLVRKVSWNFPGLETEEGIIDHRNTVLKFISKNQAICVRENNRVIGVLLFSRYHNMICCLAVDPDFRRKGIASMLLEKLCKSWIEIEILLFLHLEKTMKKVELQELYIKSLVLRKANQQWSLDIQIKFLYYSPL